METANLHPSIEGELTQTEVDIAVAEISDRFMRYLKACAVIEGDEEGQEPAGIDFYFLQKSTAEKHEIDRFFASVNIPPNVTLLHSECGLRPSSGTLAVFRPIFKHWVQGRLTKEEVNDLCFYFEEWDEVDFGWVFMDEPSSYYGNKNGDSAEIRARFAAIGSRSNRKRKGPPLAQVLGLPRSGIFETAMATMLTTNEAPSK